MSDMQAFLNQALGIDIPDTPEIPLPEAKKAEIAQVSQEKQAALGGTSSVPDFFGIAAGKMYDKGAATTKGVEQDLRTLSPSALYAKYGPVAQDLIAGMADAQAEVVRSSMDDRSAGQLAWDLGSGAVSGAANSLAGIANLGVGQVDHDAGVAMAQGIQKANQALESTQSATLNRARKLAGAKTTLTARDNQAKYEEDLAQVGGTKNLVDSLKHIGRDFIDGVGNSLESGATMTQIGAEGVGSLVAGGVATKGLKLLGNAVTGGAFTNAGTQVAAEMSRALGTPSIARTMDATAKVGGWAAWPASIAAMEGGDVYGDVAGRVMALPFDSLEKTSPTFVAFRDELLAQHVPLDQANEQARIQLAGRTAAEAAVYQAPVAAGVSLISYRIGHNPFSKAGTVSNYLRGIGLEGLEEGIQSGSGALSGNAAAKNQVDPAQSLTAGVGDAAAQGMLGGILSAGTTQTPGAVFDGTKAAGKAAVNGLGKLGEQRLDAATRGNVSEEVKAVPEVIASMADQPAEAVTQEIADTTQAMADAGATPEQVSQAESFIKTVVDTARVNPAELNLEGSSEALRAVLAPSPEGKLPNRVQALERVAEIIATSTDPAEKFQAVMALKTLADPVEKALAGDQSVLDVLPDDHPKKALMGRYISAISNISQIPAVAKAMQEAVATLSNAEEVNKQIPKVTLDMAITPEGQKAIQDTATVVAQDYRLVDADKIETIQRHASNGLIQLTPEQQQIFDVAMGLIKAERDFLNQRKANGLTKAKDVVSEEIFSLTGTKGSNEEGKASALQHATRIREAMRAGNAALAKARLEDFGLFVQHMVNKVGALQRHFDNGKPTAPAESYMALMPDDRAWKLSSRAGLKGMFVNWLNPGSVDAAQSIELEQKALADIFNTLTKAFPELGVKEITPVSLSDTLKGNPDAVVKRLRAERPKGTVQDASVSDSAETSPADAIAAQIQKDLPEGFVINKAVDQKEGWSGYALLDPDGNIVSIASTLEAGDVSLVLEEARVEAEQRANGTASLGSAEASPQGKDGTIPFTNEGSNETQTQVEKAAAATEENSSRPATDSTTKAAAEGKTETNPTNPVEESSAAVTEALQTSETTTTEPAQQAQEEVAQKSEGVTEAAVKEETQAQTQKAETQAQETLEPMSIRHLFGTLVGGASNMLARVFKLKEQAPTRIIAQEESPRELIQGALESHQALVNFIGKGDLKHTLDHKKIAVYERLLTKDFNTILVAMNDRLQMALSDKGGKLEKLLRDGDHSPLKWRGGKALNIAEQTEDGQLRYNPFLQESAILAGLQWLLVAGDTVRPLKDEQIAQMLGMSEQDIALLSPKVLSELRTGLGNDEAVNQLSRLISQFWGLQGQNDADLAFKQGIPQAVASEILAALSEAGMIQRAEIKLGKEDGLPGPRSFTQYVLPGKTFQQGTKEVTLPNPYEDVKGYPTAIQDAVLVEPERVVYLGDQVPPGAKTQMNSPDIKLTAAQREITETEAKTPHFFNDTLLRVHKVLDKDGDLAFAGLTESELPLNKQDQASQKSKRLSLIAARDQMNSLMAQVADAAGKAGSVVTEVPIRYGYNFAKNGRLNMLGGYTPQSSKYVRELVLPTWSKLDLTNRNGQDYKAFMLAVAQGLGKKVHNDGVEASVENIEKLLDGALKPVVDLLADIVTDDEAKDKFEGAKLGAQLRSMMQQAEVDTSFWALHTVAEYARYTKTSSENRKAFRTGLYVEADGVTNGPIMAMLLMSIDKFTPEWVANIRRGGVNFGAQKSLHALREANQGVDLYGKAGEMATRVIKEWVNHLAGENPKAGKLSKTLFKLMDHLDLGVDYADPHYNENGDVVPGSLALGRSLLKNPLTVILYGSSENGIAGKLTETLSNAIYKEMSKAAQAMAEDKSLSLRDALGKDTFDLLNALLGEQLVVKRNGEVQVWNGTPGLAPNTDPVSFAFQKNQLDQLQKNILNILVQPMVMGIRKTLGDSMFVGLGHIQQATQAQSLVYAEMYRQELTKLVEANKAKGGTVFVSEAEMTALAQRLEKMFPLVQANGQALKMSKDRRLADGEYEISADLEDRHRTGPNVHLPTEIGVGGIPLMNIGFGDGLMMMILALNSAVQNTLKIFDGMNMPLDRIKEQSQAANEAVFKAMQTNPYRALESSFSTFLANSETIQGLLEAEIARESDPTKRTLNNALSRTLFGSNETVPSPKLLVSKLASLQQELKDSGDMVEARHRAMADLKMSLDQMAAAEVPFTNKPNQADQDLSDEQVLELLQQGYEKHLAEIQGSRTKEEKAEKTSPFQSVGRAHSSGARVISFTALQKLVKVLGFSDGQKVILGELLRSQATKDYQIVVGSVEQIKAYNDGMIPEAAQPRKGEKLHGYIDHSTKTIFMVDPSAETLVHELVHAAVTAALQTYYTKGDLGPHSQEVTDAVKRLETLMQDFLNTAFSPLDMSSETFDAITNLKREIDRVRGFSPAAKANMLNEFLAWSLSNQKLIEQHKGTKANPLVQLAKDVIQAIKRIIWGRKVSPKPADDVLSNLQFNAGVLIRNRGNVLSQIKLDSIQRHASRGMSERLLRIQDALATQIVALVEDSRLNKQEHVKAELQGVVGPAVRVTNAFATGFNMDAGQLSVFEMVVTALGTRAEIEPTVLARMQEIYAHVADNLKVEHFLADPGSYTQAEFNEASAKFDLVMGKTGMQLDPQERSTLLPAFLGLSLVDDQFRAILEKMKPPRSVKNQDGTVDAWLENQALETIDWVERTLSGDQGSRNVRQAMDRLADSIIESVIKEKSQVLAAEEKVVDGLNTLNTQISRVIDGLAKKAQAANQNQIAQGKSSKSPARVASKLAELFTKMASEENADAVAVSIMDGATRSKRLPKAAYDLINSMVGRTSENADIYDMIKQVRAAVQQLRQIFRETVPRVIAGKFSRALTEKEWTAAFQGLAKTDLASLISGSVSSKDVLKLLGDSKALTQQITDVEASLASLVASSNVLSTYKTKAQQLARFMMTGETEGGLQRNADAIANMVGMNLPQGWTMPGKDVVAAIDKLTTLYALQHLSQQEKDILSSLVQKEGTGMEFVLSYLDGQRKAEMVKASQGKARFNHYKGHVPSLSQNGMSLKVAWDEDAAKLVSQGYVRVGDYVGTKSESTRKSMGYFLSPVSSQAAFSQGNLQNVKHTASGVDLATGLTSGMVAGRVTERFYVQKLIQRMNRQGLSDEALLPVYDESGRNIIAFERAVSPAQLARTKPSTHLANMIGVWRGRQLEEELATAINESLIDKLHAMREADLKRSAGNQAKYVDLLKSTDPVIKDAVALFTPETRDAIQAKFGNEFWVRRDMIDDVVGYRMPSVRDLFSDKSPLNQEAQKTVQHVLTAMFGSRVFKTLVQGEQMIQGTASSLRQRIIITSVIVPALNIFANIIQKLMQGVPPSVIAKGMLTKTLETNAYVKSHMRQIELETELQAVGSDVQRKRLLETQIQAIKDANKRLSIWPLLEAGEFSTISDVGMTAEDLDLTSGNVEAFMGRLIDKLPGPMKTIARYGLVTRDTPLFAGLQKATRYGDFISKAVLYEDLVKRRKMDPKEALAYISEEFVNYDRLPGRSRAYVESMGLLWFSSYKIGSVKVALRMMRRNPLHALLFMGMDPPSEIGSPLTDNLGSKLAGGTLGYSIGPSMGLHGLGLNPWFNLVN